MITTNPKPKRGRDWTEAFFTLNPREIPMVDTHFYKWMGSGGYDNDGIIVKINYLTEIGFVKGEDFISTMALDSMRYIIDTYFRAYHATRH